MVIASAPRRQLNVIHSDSAPFGILSALMVIPTGSVAIEISFVFGVSVPQLLYSLCHLFILYSLCELVCYFVGVQFIAYSSDLLLIVWFIFAQFSEYIDQEGTLKT